MAVLTQNVMTWSLPSGDIAQSSVWALYTGAPTAPQALAVFSGTFLDEVWPSAAGGIKTYYEAATVFTQLQTRTVNPVSGQVISTSSQSVTRAGTGSGNPLPAEVAVVASLRTLLAGASFRGRLYLPAMRTGIVTSTGLIDATTVTAVATAVAAGFAALAADTTYGGTSGVVYSRKTGAQTPIESVDVGNVWDAQRRRRNSIAESRTSIPV